MKTLKKTAEELQLRCDFLENAMDNNAKIIVEFAEENDRLKKELEYKDQLLQSVLEDLDDACNEVVKLEDRCENMVQELNDADDKIDALTDDIADLCGDNDTLHCELLEARTDLAAAKDELRKLSKCHLNRLYGSSVYEGNMNALTHILQSLKADGIIPQYVDTDSIFKEEV